METKTTDPFLDENPEAGLYLGGQQQEGRGTERNASAGYGGKALKDKIPRALPAENRLDGFGEETR